jgi:lysophospholipase L1-like esterase
MKTTKTHLALGDSMSIDLYTGVPGGGAVAQLFRRLQAREPGCWRLDDRTCDGCTIEGVARLLPLPPADLVTMTVGGNDLVQNMDRDPEEAMPEFARGYNALLDQIAECTAGAIVVAGNVYHPQADFPVETGLDQALDWANQIITDAIAAHGFRLANIYSAFRGHEQEYLCMGIEPTLKGATVIAGLFEQAAFGE